MPQSREHEIRPVDGKEKNTEGPKSTHIYRYIDICIYVQRSPSGCVRSEIPAVTQVGEKGHEGNTAVVATRMFKKRKRKTSAVSTTD